MTHKAAPPYSLSGLATVSDSRTFLALSQQTLAASIRGARKRAVYAAPGASLEVAGALIQARARLGDAAVAVLLDVSETALRLGYGVVDSIAELRTHGVPIRDAGGLRIAFAVVDEEGFIFVLPPLLVEDSRRDDAQPNAVRAAPEQVRLLVAAVLPPPKQMDLLDHSARKAQRGGNDGPAPSTAPEFAPSIVAPARIRSVETAIAANPVENFDLARIVHVFSACIQFFEFEVRGAQLQNQTVQLPKNLLASIKDRKTRDRISAAFKLVAADSQVSGAEIRTKAAEIRKRFIRHHPVYGGVVLKSSLKALDAEIAKLDKLVQDHREKVRKRFATDAKKSIQELVQAFWRDIARDPPDELVDQIGRQRPTTEEAKEYLEYALRQAFPTADQVADGMKITRVVKDVTWSTLQDREFVDWLRKAFPLRKDLQKPFELYRAAKGIDATKR